MCFGVSSPVILYRLQKKNQPTAATVIGTSAAVALGATIGSGVLGDGTKNSLPTSLSKLQNSQIVQSVGKTFQGAVGEVPNIDFPDLPDVPDLPDLPSLPGPVNNFIDTNLGKLKNKFNNQFKKSPTPVITPYVVKLPYLEEKIETAEQQQQQQQQAPSPATAQPQQVAQEDFQRKLREAEEAAAREKKLEAEAAAAKAKAAAEAENKLLQMEAQKAVMKQQQAANEFSSKLAQAEAAASVVATKETSQPKPAAAAKSPSAKQTSETFEKWQAAQRAKAQQKATNVVDNIKPVPASSLKPPAAKKTATATTSKLSTYEEWQARQRALRDGSVAANSATYRPIVPNTPPGSVGRMTSSEQTFIALTGVGISAATLGSVFNRKGNWDESQATPASEISNQFIPKAPVNPPPKKKMIEDLPKKLQQPPPLPVQPQFVQQQQQQQQFTPPPPPPPIAPPAPEPTPAPAPVSEVITSPTHEIARPDSASKAAVASSSDGNYLQALGGGGSSSSSGNSPKKSYSPFGAKKPAAPSAGTLYSPPGGGGGDYTDSVSSFSFTNQHTVSSMPSWSPPIPPAGSLSSKMKPSAYSPFGGGKKPVAAASRGDTLYAPPSSIEPVDSISSFSSSTSSSSEVAAAPTPSDTMFFTNDAPAVNGDDEQLEEGTNHVGYENTNGYEYEANSDGSSSSSGSYDGDDYTVEPTTAGDPIPYNSMPGSSSFGGAAAVVKPSSYSPFGSKPKAPSNNDSLYGPPS